CTREGSYGYDGYYYVMDYW
nr:immunoglobulin heavy chain junction region [Mus musculus]